MRPQGAPAIVLAALLTLLATILPLGAQPGAVPGAGEPPLQSALAAWLSDDESAALPVLADLAKQGNAAARLMLALIDTTPALQGPFLSLQSRATRVALMRAPGGMSGQNWLNLLADLPLAAAWRRLRQVDAGPDLIAAFSDLGEARAARLALVTLAAREHPALRDLAPDSVDPALLYLLWPTATEERRAQIQTLVPDHDPQRAAMGSTLPPEALDHWLAESPLAAPLARLCDALCPGEGRPACRRTAFEALGSHDALLTLGSPVESLVAQDTFLSSPRGRATVLRRILMAAPMRGRRAMLARIETESQCLGVALVEEAHRYRPASIRTVQDG